MAYPSVISDLGGGIALATEYRIIAGSVADLSRKKDVAVKRRSLRTFSVI
jgi:hypothetical protein